MRNHILLITSEFPPLPGGIGNHAYHLASELTSSGREVSVITERRESVSNEWNAFTAENKHLQISGIKRYRIRGFTYLARVVRAFLGLRMDVWEAVIFSGKFPVLINGIFGARRSIVVLHGSELQQGTYTRALFHRGLRSAKLIICVSEYTRNILYSKYPAIKEKSVRVINNGIRNDLTRLSIRGSSSLGHDDLRLITVGGIHRRKGQLNVVASLPRLIKEFPMLHYHIVGIPSEKEPLLEAIKQNGLERFVSFHHGLCNGEVQKILENQHIFIMLSEHLENGDFEGFGIAIVEAMALGLPAIGSKDSGIEDAIVDGYSGRLVDPKKPDEITSAVKQICEKYQWYSQNARDTAERMRWSSKITEYIDAIEQL